MRPIFDSDSLIDWFQQEKRDLPWRKNLDPYAVWVSEVMLQQTQVSVVVPYFERWMEKFPTIDALAASTLDEVIKLWEGLGYYSRARNLHQGARDVKRLFDGKLPSSEKELSAIKGLGPYTIGAIRSFAFREKTAAVDGNVLRVIARYFQITDDISKGKTQTAIRNLVLEILPENEHYVVNEALIELGATLCKKTPKCVECPLKRHCKSRINGTVHEIPNKPARPQTIPLFRAVAIICSGSLFLVRRGAKGAIMQGLYEFPYFETSEEGISAKSCAQKISEVLELDANPLQSLKKVSHSFTKYKVTLQPFLLETHCIKDIPGYSWYTLQEFEQLAFSSGHRRICTELRTAY